MLCIFRVCVCAVAGWVSEWVRTIRRRGEREHTQENAHTDARDASESSMVFADVSSSERIGHGDALQCFCTHHTAHDARRRGIRQ